MVMTPNARHVICAIVVWSACGPPGTDRGAEAAPSIDASPPPLPASVTNNAVTVVRVPGGEVVLSFLGLDESLGPAGITRDALRWDVGSRAWTPIAPVPGPPRIAATAQSVRGRAYVFGGYTVEEDGSERSVPEVYAYDPVSDVWSRAAPLPVPVDDAVSGVWRDSLIFLISGWSDRDNVDAVQAYDPSSDSWRRATPIPGPPVFGHAGGIAGNTIIYVDGTRLEADSRRFALERSSWRGEIDPLDPTRIAWTRAPDHPGPGLYRAAALGSGSRVVFVGGTDNPYNYDGIGYDGRPSEPVATAFAWDTTTERWIELGPPTRPTMDHRGLVRVAGRLFTLGGMTVGRRVIADAVELP